MVRDEMEKMLHVVDGKVPESLKKCFSEVFNTSFISLHEKIDYCIVQFFCHIHASTLFREIKFFIL